ncbi:MAG: hypothetical protein II903_01410 [Spirochaetales bacterium]|nr:hypothetical protein [Spirochaetales bacterium]
MSRSKRKPYWSMADSVKDWKKSAHRKMRSKVKMQMYQNPDTVPVIVDECEYSDVFDSPRDGSAQYVRTDEADKEERKRLTRK